MTQEEKDEKPQDEKEKRKQMIAKELETILQATETYCLELLEEEFEDEASKAITKAAYELAYRKKYYDVIKDEIIFFPSVAKLVMKGDLQEGAEAHYWEEEDEFPLEYSKALKSVPPVNQLTGKQKAMNRPLRIIKVARTCMMALNFKLFEQF